MPQAFKNRRRATTLFASAASLFTFVFILLLLQFTQSQGESRQNWEEASRTFNDATPNIDLIYESLQPGRIPEYLLFATHDNQENYFYIAAGAAKAPLEAVETLQATFRSDSVAQPILTKLHGALIALSELPLTDRQLVDAARDLLFFDPSEMQQVYSEIQLLRSIARESVRELEARGINESEKLSLFIRAGWAAVLLAIATTFGFILHIRRLQRIADQGRKDAERRLELEQEAQEAREASVQLEAAVAAAQVAAKSKDMFLALASHEIRTPLTGMLGMITLLHDSELNQEQDEMVRTLEGSSRQLLAILNDILDAAKLRETGFKLQSESTQLAGLTGLVRSTFEPMAAAKQLDFLIEVPPSLADQHYLVDSVRLVQVLNNLVSNAIKFTDRGKVALRVELLDKDDISHRLLFSVVDSGDGIPEDLIETLSEPFTQIDNELNRNKGGTGLGLTISKSLIGLMGGELNIESTVGKGSCFKFSIWLPLGVSQNDVVHASATTADLMVDIDQCNKPRILIAEDNPVNRMVIDKMLAKLPLNYTIVENGQEAVDELSNHAYHLVLTDIQMPQLDGFEATKQMRQLKNGKDIPIIALSAATFDDDRARMTAAGMDDFVSKPIDRPKLVKTLELHLQGYQTEPTV